MNSATSKVSIGINKINSKYKNKIQIINVINDKGYFLY